MNITLDWTNMLTALISIVSTALGSWFMLRGKAVDRGTARDALDANLTEQQLALLKPFQDQLLAQAERAQVALLVAQKEDLDRMRGEVERVRAEQETRRGGDEQQQRKMYTLHEQILELRTESQRRGAEVETLRRWCSAVHLVAMSRYPEQWREILAAAGVPPDWTTIIPMPPPPQLPPGAEPPEKEPTS